MFTTHTHNNILKKKKSLFGLLFQLVYYKGEDTLELHWQL